MKAQHWKCCIGATLSRVRIPLSPFYISLFWLNTSIPLSVKNVLKYDHVKPKDLNYWCKYVGISIDEFFKIADKFRSKAVWWIENKKWHRHCIDGKVRSYGFTTFTTKEINKFNKN